MAEVMSSDLVGKYSGLNKAKMGEGGHIAQIANI